MIVLLKLPVSLFKLFQTVSLGGGSRVYAKIGQNRHVKDIYMYMYIFLKALMATSCMRRGADHVRFGGSGDGILVSYRPSTSCAPLLTSLAILYSLTFLAIWIGIACSI